MNFLMGYDIDIQQLSLIQLKNLKFLDEIPFKKCVSLHFFSNECTILNFFKEKTTTILKRRRFYKGHFIIFSISKL
jgi:hypothetical protein